MAITFDIEAESERLDAEKPYTELIDGVEVRKSMPMTQHAILQGEMWALVRQWAGGRGIVGTELRVWLHASSVMPTSLVPDVAFIAFERLHALSECERQLPPIAPDVVVEIRSPSDRESNVARKIALYLDRGAKLVIDVRPARREMSAHDAMPGFTFAIEAFFARGDVA